MYKIINADPPNVSQLNPDVPEQMDAVIRKALEKDLYSRYRNGAEFAKDLAAVRYKILDENYVAPDTGRFAQLRKLAFFTEFEDVELWEVLRISSWRKVERHVSLVREGDSDQRFGIVLDGSVELSIEGRRVIELGVGEVFGAQAWLDHIEHRHMMSVVSLSPLTYLEINPAALALASEEVLERFRRELATVIVRRLALAARQLSAAGPPAVRGEFTATGGLDLQLLEP